MVTYYIYEVPGVKVGATLNLNRRLKYNFEKYNVEPILLETLQGPDNEDMWRVVGDREWELADEKGYDRGEHYRVMRLRASFESQSLGGKIGGKVGGLIGGRISGPISTAIERTCPHCEKTFKGPCYYTWHGDNCKHKKRTAN